MLLQQGQLESTVTQKCNLLSVSMERCFLMGSTSSVVTTHHVKREQNLKLITVDTASHWMEETPDVQNSVNTISVRHITGRSATGVQQHYTLTSTATTKTRRNYGDNVLRSATPYAHRRRRWQRRVNRTASVLATASTDG